MLHGLVAHKGPADSLGADQVYYHFDEILCASDEASQPGSQLAIQQARKQASKPAQKSACKPPNCGGQQADLKGGPGGWEPPRTKTVKTGFLACKLCHGVSLLSQQG